MRPPTNNWRQRLIEHYLYVEIVADIITRNTERDGQHYVQTYTKKTQ